MKRGVFVMWSMVVLAGALLAGTMLPGCATGKARLASWSIAGGGSDGSSQRLRSAALPGSLPALNEEVWVIVKHDAAAAQLSNQDEIPGTGALVGRFPDQPEEKQVPMPLRHTEVRTNISAYIASVEVTQQFHNPYSSKIEAVYVFPLPDNAAVNGFVMSIGERRIRGIIREREEARRIYDEAKHHGYVASLLTQERPNVFTQHVANIEPEKQIDIHITYFHTLAYDDGWYEYVFPMVVGPRFNPPHITDGIGAVPRGTYGFSGQATEVQYLKPHERSGHDIALTVDLDAGVSIEEVICNSHRIETTREGSERLRIELANDDRIPNKDFVLRYRVAGDEVKTALLTHRDDSGDYFAFMMFPPREQAAVERRPMEMVFVIDCSGSMNGQPIKQARDAIDHALQQLRPHDTFQVIVFSERASQLGPNPVLATEDNIANARKYVRSLSADGGTMMLTGLNAALDFANDPGRFRVVTFLTDGYIGNEAEILETLQRKLGASRVFSFGVGSSTNRYLLESMARVGRGAVAYLGPRGDGRDVMDRYLKRVSSPVLSDIAIDFGDMAVEDVTPASIPDLFVGRPVVVAGRFKGEPSESIRVQGKVGGRLVEATIEFDAEQPERHKALASVWARMQISQLMDRALVDRGVELPQAITSLALQHSLLSPYTSFVAVDSLTRTAGERGTTVGVAVPMPEGVEYRTTVPE